jgi:hypothetical protein
MNYTRADAFAVDGTTGHHKHQDTNPVPTAVTAEDLNMVIWSLMKVIEAAGVTPAYFDPANPATYNRLQLAVQALATSADMSLTTNGWRVGADGLVEMWGTYTPDVTGSGSTEAQVTINWPRIGGWPAACLNLQLQPINAAASVNADTDADVVSWNGTGFTVTTRWATGGSNVLHGFMWRAIGH